MHDKIVLADKLARIERHFDPKIIGALNGQHLKLVKIQGDFTWHRHAHEDELFLVIAGEFDMQFRERTITVRAGECIIVPRGVEHCPRADHEASVLLVEPAGTLNTGDAGGAQTVAQPGWI